MPRYIDADALKDVIQQHDYPLADRLNSVDNGMFTTGIFQAIDQMPTISPDEVRGVGRWLDTPYDIECSKCHEEFDSEVACCDIYGWLWKFCPSCGAKMEAIEDA